MKTVRLTMAQALVKFLDKQYLVVDGKENKFVKGFMGIFGHGNVVGIGQALEQYKDEVIFIQGKNEQEIAHACTAYAKQKDRKEIFACTASIGPGSLNLVTAAGTATVNRIPVLLLPSDAFADRQPDPVLQQMEKSDDYTVSVNDSFKAVCKYWDRIQRPEQLMTACLNAMRVLTDPELTGAVALCLPQDVQGESYDYPVDFFEKRCWYVDRVVASDSAITRAVELIKGKKKPFIISGGGVRYSDAGKEILEFAEKFNIPVAETQAGKGEITFDNKYNLGCVGVCGTLSANLIAKDADIIIAVGTKLNDFVTSSKAAFKNDTSIVSINVSRMDALKMNSISVVADAKEGIISLSNALEKESYESSYKDEFEVAKAKWIEERNRISEEVFENGLSQGRVLTVLNEILDDNAIIVAAAGSMPSDLERLWIPKTRGQYHLEYGFSCMGYEISGAFGAKLAQPERESYAFIGDGVFMMGHSDLVTSLQEGVKINVMLFDNNGHQCIHNLQRAQGCDSFGTEFRYRQDQTKGLTGNYLDIDFATIAKAYGAVSYKVTTIEELKVAVEDSKKQTRSTLIEIKVLPGTMTGGYENFWRVGTASVSESEKVQKAYDVMKNKVDTLRKY
jgi:3D-(3,5/4)-trihydroxycyclohexane-1,2-dione acylhydrolase (decyclizing)